MKVLVVHPGAELFGSDGMLLESVRGLVAARDRVVVALPEGGPLVAPLLAAGARVVVIPMLVLRKALLRPRNWGRLVRAVLRGGGAADRLLRRVHPDVVYVSTITLPQWPLAARLRRVPSVLHAHEAEASRGAWMDRVLHVPQRFCAQIIANSEFTLATLRRPLPALAARGVVVLNGIESPDETAAPRDELDVLHIAYVGRLSPRKGPDLVVAALAELDRRGVDADLTLVGSVFTGYEWYRSELEQAIQNAGLSHRVHVAGFVADVWPILAAADVVVVPSRVDESFGNIAVEAVLARRPVVVSAVGALPEAVAGYATAVIVHTDDVTALADGLAEVRTGWQRLSPLTGDSRAIARARHAPERYGADVAAAVHGVLVSPAPR